MKIIITGGAGFIGSAFIKHLVQNNETLLQERVLPKTSYRDMMLVYIKRFYKKIR